jgi:hypothetical protein
MTTAPAFLSWALAVAPTSTSHSFAVADVDVHRSKDATQITAYDDDGEVAGEVFVWVDAAGQARLDVTFPDGVYLSATSDGTSAHIDTNDGPAVAERAKLLDVALKDVSALPEWIRCGGPAAFAALECATLNVLGCAGGTFWAGCECIDYFTHGEHSCYE